jgi:hypothetical protein
MIVARDGCGGAGNEGNRQDKPHDLVEFGLPARPDRGGKYAGGGASEQLVPELT